MGSYKQREGIFGIYIGARDDYDEKTGNYQPSPCATQRRVIDYDDGLGTIQRPYSSKILRACLDVSACMTPNLFSFRMIYNSVLIVPLIYATNRKRSSSTRNNPRCANDCVLQ